MKKTDLINLMRCTQAELAAMLGITQGAVSQWDEVPTAPYLRLRYEIAPHLPWPDKAPETKSKDRLSRIAACALIAVCCCGFLFVCMA